MYIKTQSFFVEQNMGALHCKNSSHNISTTDFTCTRRLSESQANVFFMLKILKQIGPSDVKTVGRADTEQS